jgi:hypothetical protein
LNTSLGLPGFKTLLYGDSGDGKTHVLRTLLKHGITPLVQATEPGMRALAPCDNAACPVCKDTRTAPPIPWSYVPPTAGDIKSLITQAEWISKYDQKYLCNVVDNTRSQHYNQFSLILKNIENFVDSTGKSWGPVPSWNTDRAYVLDGLTETGAMAMDLFCGKRPLYDKPDYQIAQKAVLNFIKLLTCQIRCPVIVVAHLDSGEDVMGRPKGTVLTIGRKLAPDLPRLFDDMPFAYREGDKFFWSTAKFGMASKGRNLPIKDAQAPDFGTIVESWKRAGGQIQPTEATK